MNGQRMLHGERPYLDFPVYAARRGHILLCPVQGVWTSYLASQVCGARTSKHPPFLNAFLHQASKCDSPLLQRLGFHGCNGHPDTRTQSSKISNRGSFAGLGTVNK
jgi:hypothetical protein